MALVVQIGRTTNIWLGLVAVVVVQLGGKRPSRTLGVSTTINFSYLFETRVLFFLLSCVNSNKKGNAHRR